MTRTGPAVRARDESEFYASLLALGLGAVAIIVMAWFAAEMFASRMADLEAERRAVKWSERALTSLQMGKPSFDQARLSTADKARLHDLLLASDIYRYSLYDAKGVIFWSSKLSRIGSAVEGGFFRERVAKGELHAASALKKPSAIDGLLWRKGTFGLDPDTDRSVIEVYIPVMMSDRFVGAIEVDQDMTDLTAFYAHRARTAASVLSAVFGSVFLLVGAMMYSYARERRRNMQALLQARDEALDSERDARDLAQELQRMNDEVVKLNRDLAENMRRLSEAQDEIIRKGKLAQLGQLTATVAHEIRNPLGVVRTAAYLLDRKLKDKEPAARQALRRISNGIVRCDTIITELLDFARTGAPHFSSERIDDWLEAIVREEAERLPECVAIECHLGIGDTTAMIDSGRLQRVVINLLCNASEAMVGKGTYQPSECVGDPRIVVTTRQSERGVEIEVADNGPGIPPENFERILEPLFTTKSFGVGLGLPAVQKILEQHGGGLEVRSSPGKGATFVAWFPREQKGREAA